MLNKHLKTISIAMEYVRDSIYLADMDDVIVFVNRAFCQTYGMSKEEVVGKPGRNLWQSTVAYVDHRSHLADHFEQGWEGDTEHKHKTNGIFFVSLSVSPIFNEEGTPTGVLGIVRDVTERKIVEETMTLRSRAFGEIMEGVSIADPNLPDNPLIYVNEGFERLTGYSMYDVVGQNCRFLQGPETDPAAVEKIRQALKEKRKCTVDLINYRKNGTPFWNRVSMTPYFNDQGKLINFVGIQSDITLIKDSEQRLQELNASKDKFFSIISHDLQSPLAMVLSSTEMLANRALKMKPEKVQRFASNIHNSAKRLNDLLKNLLTWARLQSGRMAHEPTRLEPKGLIHNTVTLLEKNASDKQIKVAINLEGEHWVYADKNMVETVFRNLLSNAIKFTPTGGQVYVDLIERGEMLECHVRDTGVGISEPNQKKLFAIGQHFTTMGTNQEQGTGVGLILCKDFVERNGGTIKVESTLGQGTTFKFTLPIAN